MVDVPSKSGSTLDVTLDINSVANLGCSFRLPKNLKTAFYANICMVVWFQTTYRMLFLVSFPTLKTHLIIFLAKISALEKTALVGSNVVSTLLRHA